MFVVCFLAFLLALAAFVVGWIGGKDKIVYLLHSIFPVSILRHNTSLVATEFTNFIVLSDKPFVGASVGYFSFLALVAGRALTVSSIQCLPNHDLNVIPCGSFSLVSVCLHSLHLLLHNVPFSFSFNF